MLLVKPYVSVKVDIQCENDSLVGRFPIAMMEIVF